MNALISVIIPVYNPGEHLKKCLDSILGQTYRNLEVILVDDGSSDGSEKVCDEFAAKDDRVVCVHQPNSGVSKTRNAGIALAHGDYVHFPDSDDYLEPDTYEYLLSLIEEHDCDAVNFEYYTTWSAKETLHQVSDENYGMFDADGAHRVIMSGEPFCWNKFFKKHLIDGLTFRVDIFRGEDSLFAHQALDRAEKVWFDRRPLYHYVQSEESACRGKFRTSQLSAIKLYDAYEPLLREKYPKLWSRFLTKYENLHATLYADMLADEQPFTEERKDLFRDFKAHYCELDWRTIPSGQKTKLKLFRRAPRLYSRIHRRHMKQ